MLFFCANDEMAWGCIRALTEAGHRVPQEVSVMGFDDITLSAFYTPALTTIHSPVTEIGTCAALEIMRLLRQEDDIQGKITRLKPNLVIRDSCEVRI